MNGWENIEKNYQINVQCFLQQLFVFRNDPIHQQFDIICWTYISNTCISLSPTHSLLMGWRWWNTLITTTHVTLYTYSYVIAVMLFIILPTCHVYAVIKHLSF